MDNVVVLVYYPQTALCTMIVGMFASPELEKCNSVVML